jgi:hypothetical protein
VDDLAVVVLDEGLAEALVDDAALDLGVGPEQLDHHERHGRDHANRPEGAFVDASFSVPGEGELSAPFGKQALGHLKRLVSTAPRR